MKKERKGAKIYCYFLQFFKKKRKLFLSSLYFNSDDTLQGMDSRNNIERLISSIHKAIRDGDYERLAECLEQADNSRACTSSRCKNILWEPNVSGWTAVHFAAAHFLPLEWWEWILRRAADDDDDDETEMSRFAFHHEYQRAALGQSVLDIFLKSFFDPFPWQSEAISNRSRQLLQALKVVLDEDRLIQEIQQQLCHRRQQSEQQRPQPSNNSHPIIARRPPSCTVVVYRVVSFLQYFECLCRHCAPATKQWSKGDEITTKYHSSMSLLHVCCHFMSGGSSTTAFPRPLAQLLLALDPDAPRRWRQVQVSYSTKSDNKDSNSSDRSGFQACWFLPLHSWAGNTNTYTMPHHRRSSPPRSHVNNCDDDDDDQHFDPATNDDYHHHDPLVSSLLAAYPESAQMTPMAVHAVTTETRREKLPQPTVVARLPLHIALAAGRSWYHGLQSLFLAFPGSVQCIDPVTQLFPVALAATAAPSHDHTRTNLLPVAGSLNVSFSCSRSFHYTQEVILVRARQICAGEKGLSAMWQLVPPERRQRAIQAAEHELDCEHLTTIFELLRAYPRALDCRNRKNMNNSSKW